MPPSTKIVPTKEKEPEIVRKIPQKEHKRYPNFNYKRRSNLKDKDIDKTKIERLNKVIEAEKNRALRPSNSVPIVVKSNLNSLRDEVKNEVTKNADLAVKSNQA